MLILVLAFCMWDYLLHWAACLQVNCKWTRLEKCDLAIVKSCKRHISCPDVTCCNISNCHDHFQSFDALYLVILVQGATSAQARVLHQTENTTYQTTLTTDSSTMAVADRKMYVGSRGNIPWCTSDISQCDRTACCWRNNVLIISTSLSFSLQVIHPDR